MVDLLFVVILVAFFALMVAFVRICERIVGKEEALGAGPVGQHTSDTDVDTDTVTEEVPA